MSKSLKGGQTSGDACCMPCYWDTFLRNYNNYHYILGMTLAKTIQSYWDQTTARPPAEHYDPNQNKSLIRPAKANQNTSNLPPALLLGSYTE